MYFAFVSNRKDPMFTNDEEKRPADDRENDDDGYDNLPFTD